MSSTRRVFISITSVRLFTNSAELTAGKVLGRGAESLDSGSLGGGEPAANQDTRHHAKDGPARALRADPLEATSRVRLHSITS